MLGFEALGRRALGQATADRAISADYGAVELTSSGTIFAVGMPSVYGTFSLTAQTVT